jgi:adenosine kinase
VTGSLAFDHIMRFPGYFKDNILPDKIHMFNVSFVVSSLTRQRGGTGGNIAYSLALLGLTPRLFASAGHDCAAYLDELRAVGVDTSAVDVVDDFTASAFIMTDNSNNQITGFYPGAMNQAGERPLREVATAETTLALVSANSPTAIRRFPGECRELGIPYVHDLGMSLPILTDEDLIDGLTGAEIVIGNDYEMALIAERTGFDRDELRRRARIIVTTLGSQGSEIDAQGDIHRIPVAAADPMVDPTGAGDAYRSGLVLGLTRGFPLPVAGRIASLAATYAVEHLGTQAHSYTTAEFAERFNRTFPDVPPLTAALNVERGA